MTDWVLGLDGGGTKTTLALVDQSGKVWGPLKGKGINPFDQSNWKSVFTDLLRRTNIDKEQIVGSCFGMPGFGEVETISNEQRVTVAAWAGTIPTIVLNDVEVAFVGAFQEKAGVLVLAGTGSMIWGRDTAQHQVRVGGWGELIGDEGSAFWVGMRALRQLTWILDGRLNDTEFGQALQDATGTHDGDQLLQWCYAIDHLRSRVAQLAPVVSSLAEMGNITAQDILNKAANHLWIQAATAKELLKLTEPVNFSYAGGMFSSKAVRDLLQSHVTRVGNWYEPALPPVGGALWQAATKAGWNIDQDWIKAVRIHLQEAEKIDEPY
jgi:glucosamine kinase